MHLGAVVAAQQDDVEVVTVLHKAHRLPDQRRVRSDAEPGQAEGLALYRNGIGDIGTSGRSREYRCCHARCAKGFEAKLGPETRSEVIIKDAEDNLDLRIQAACLEGD